jgi:tellurite resistance protein TerC
MYFLLAAAKRFLCHLEKAVIGILFFIGTKLIVGFFGFHISPNISLGIVLGSLSLGIIASYIFPETEDATQTS